jgi:SAM-dependent methyltransferase
MYRVYWALQRVIAPGLKNSQFAYRDKLTALVSSQTRWLDLGCGHRLLPEWMPDGDRQSEAIVARAGDVVGIDCDFQSLAQNGTIERKVCGELHHLPFKDGMFDLVTANMVVEHLANPEIALQEIARVMKPGGIFVCHTPNAVAYSSLFARLVPQRLLPHFSRFLLGRKVEDVYPTFYRLNTRSAITGAASSTHLEVLDYIPLESSAQSVILGPVVVPELLLIKLLRLKVLENFRTNILAVLRKPVAS